MVIILIIIIKWLINKRKTKANNIEKKELKINN